VKASTGFLLGALLVGALGIGGTVARDTVTIHVGDSLAWHYTITTDDVLGVAPGGRIVAKTCGTSKTFARLYILRQPTHDSIAIAGDSVTAKAIAPVGGTCTAPAKAIAPVGGTCTDKAIAPVGGTCTAPASVPLSALKTMTTACESTLVINGYRGDTGLTGYPAALPSPACDDWKLRITAKLVRIKDSLTAANAAKPPE
jgi:hypothetical protein